MCEIQIFFIIIYNGEERIIMEKSYFAAANTERGFVSLFTEIFDVKSLSHFYIIKGGPGTGKSTFMRKIVMEAKARGFDTELYYCSADTRSLDGIKIPALGVAIADGTSPHTLDPRFPGACDSIIDLGAFFDKQKLKYDRAEIISLTELCSSYYLSAKRFLTAWAEVERAKLDICAKAFDREKAKKAAFRLVSRLNSEKGDISTRYISAIGVHGCAHIDEMHENAEKIVRVTGKYGFSVLFMDELFAAVREHGLKAVRYPNVLMPEKTEGVYIGSTIFIISESEDTQGDIVNTKRFVNGETLSLLRGKIRFAEKCASALKEGALGSLSLMGKAHDELERYYIGAMDFERAEVIFEKVKAEIFGCENKKCE